MGAASNQTAPTLLTSEWPEFLRKLTQQTDPPCQRVQYLLDMHVTRCASDQGDVLYGGPAYFAHFLGYGGVGMAANAMSVHPCHKHISVLSGGPVDIAVSASQDQMPGVHWHAPCGKVVLCRNCAMLVTELGTSFEFNSTSDVIARHLAALIGKAVLRRAVVDNDVAGQLRSATLEWPV